MGNKAHHQSTTFAKSYEADFETVARCRPKDIPLTPVEELCFAFIQYGLYEEEIPFKHDVARECFQHIKETTDSRRKNAAERSAKEKKGEINQKDLDNLVDEAAQKKLREMLGL